MAAVLEEIPAKDWPKYFKPEEWPANVVHSMDASVFRVLFRLREHMGFKMWPSAFPRAHVREDGNSRHSLNGGQRLSDATDMHVATYGFLELVYQWLIQQDDVGGVGVYFDTNTPMFHVDTRPRNQRLCWYRKWVEDEKGERVRKYFYLYPEGDAAEFHKALREEFKRAKRG